MRALIIVIGWLDSLEVILYHFAGFHDLSLSISLCETSHNHTRCDAAWACVVMKQTDEEKRRLV